MESFVQIAQILGNCALVGLAIYVGIVLRHQLGAKDATIEQLREALAQARCERSPEIADEAEKIRTFAKGVIEEKNRIDAELQKSKAESTEKDRLVERAWINGSVIALMEALLAIWEVEALKTSGGFATLGPRAVSVVETHLRQELEILKRGQMPEFSKVTYYVGAAQLEPKH